MARFYYRYDGALDRLVGLLSDSDAELQIECVWCVANITAGEHEATLRVAKSTAPYMVTYLSSDNHNLQVYFYQYWSSFISQKNKQLFSQNIFIFDSIINLSLIILCCNHFK